MAWSCISMISALRTQNARLVQSLFVVVFPFLYITTSQAPRQLLPPTFRELATYNPVTYIIEGVRALVLSNWGDHRIWQGFLVALVLFVVMTGITRVSFQKTLK
jgi:ABC-2 type transport system permease protein